MHLVTVLATSLAAVSSVFAVQFDGLYTIISAQDATALTLDAQSKVVSVNAPITKSSVWYINSGSVSGNFAWIANIRPDGVLTANNSFISGGYSIDKSQALGASFFSDVLPGDRTQQAWRINPVNQGGQSVFEIESDAFRGSLLDIRGDGNDTRQVLVYQRNGGLNQLWKISPFNLYDGAGF